MNMYSTQYLVGALFAWITAAMHRGMEFLYFCFLFLYFFFLSNWDCSPPGTWCLTQIKYSAFCSYRPDRKGTLASDLKGAGARTLNMTSGHFFISSTHINSDDGWENLIPSDRCWKFSLCSQFITFTALTFFVSYQLCGSRRTKCGKAKN